MDTEQRMAQEGRAIWATVICFVVGTGLGATHGQQAAIMHEVVDAGHTLVEALRHH